MKNYIIYLLLFSTSVSYGQKRFVSTFAKYNVEGSTTIYHQNKRKWLYTDSADALKSTAPLSTFNILNSCIALETGVIKTENELIKREGRIGKGAADVGKATGGTGKGEDHETDLKTAFKNDNNWYFTALAKRIENKDYREFLKACGYGNQELDKTDTDFWNTGGIGISPIQQINFLRYFNSEQLPFSPRTFRVVKELVGIEKTDAHKILNNTSTANVKGKEVSWYIGCIQKGDNVYYFATRLVKPASKSKAAFAKVGKEITLDILKQIKAFD